MNANFAKGFTLIEIMVVIVIMGILAAVAVPKLFGNVAKAKSSELPIAASTYMKLQDAATGLHSAVGNWNTIGYEAPGKNGVSAYFQYSEGELTAANTSFDGLESGKIGWQATNIVGLNGCTKGSWWTITLSPVTGKSQVNYNAQVSADKCMAIASDFTKGNVTGVGNTTAGGSSSSYVPPNGKTQIIGQNLFAKDSMSRTNGRIHPQNGYTAKDGNPNEYAWKMIENTANTEGTWKGTYTLEPNTEYELTISVPEDAWDMSKGQFLQTEVCVYTQEPNGQWPAIMLGTRPESDMAAEDPKKLGDVKEAYTKEDGTTGYKYPNGNGYNTGTGTAENGYTASSSIKTENGMVTTTIKITTGADGGHLAANLFSYGEGWTNNRNNVADEAISKATLVKTADTEKEEKD